MTHSLTANRPSRAPEGRRKDERADILVLGAGVIGVTTAYALARRGLSVALVDRAEEAGRGTSFANGGQLSYAYTDALAQPGLIAKMPGMILGLDPAFRIRPSLDPDFLRWGLAFLRNCTNARFAHNTRAALALALESQAAMADLLARHSLDFAHESSGKLHLLRDAGGIERAEQVAALKRAAGIDQHILTGAEAMEIEPALADAGPVAAAIWTPSDAVGDPYAFCRQLCRLATEHHGVQPHFGFDLTALERSAEGVVAVDRAGRQIAARRAVVCLGAEAARFLAPMGIRMPVAAMKGYSFTAPALPHSPRVSITDTGRKIVFCRLGDQMRIAGLAELNNWCTDIEAARMNALVDGARAAMPEAADYERLHSPWAGLRPMTPNSLPIIKAEDAALFLNIGHGMLGWTFAMGAAERLAALVEEVGVTAG
ncbi:FAD-dependent oxidoreductase [Sphingopyxis sp. MWB1]|uniref:FAD-dependent oxidoreductase n=1 Tax=Sphingopyxis sp. MWB1 TaxID=1537715 RepID=UPI00068ECF52|nr:FAD-dependent oxidoreductase [Sphingopyxis sp. MWB1]